MMLQKASVEFVWWGHFRVQPNYSVEVVCCYVTPHPPTLENSDLA